MNKTKQLIEAAIDQKPLDMKESFNHLITFKIREKLDEVAEYMPNVFFEDSEIEEEFEQLDELSRKTLGRYVKKAADDMETRGAEADKNNDLIWTKRIRGDEIYKQQRNKAYRKHDNRRKGIDRAVDKLTKESEQIDELSKKTLGRYVKKASSDLMTKNLVTGTRIGLNSYSNSDIDRADKRNTKRTKGIDRAVDKLTKESSYGTMSQANIDAVKRYKAGGKAASDSGPEKGPSDYLDKDVKARGKAAFKKEVGSKKGFALSRFLKKRG